MWERRENCTRFWWESPRKEMLGRPRENGIRMDLREIGLVCVDWIGLAQDRDW
jgi:hypothetical protein